MKVIYQQMPTFPKMKRETKRWNVLETKKEI